MNENIEGEIEELNELENHLLRIKGGVDSTKIELRTEVNDQSIDLDSSPSPMNKKTKLSIKNAFHKTTKMHSVTIDLNSTKGNIKK